MTRRHIGLALDIPVDVIGWLLDTYKTEGIDIWLDSYVNGDEAHRARMIANARRDGNCS